MSETILLTRNGENHADMIEKSWGCRETLTTDNRFQVRRIVVEPGQTQSLQCHMNRAEHWVVVAGTAKVTIEEQNRLVSENESIYVPTGAVHKLENPGLLPMVLIAVQTGCYLDDDAIIRCDEGTLT